MITRRALLAQVPVAAGALALGGCAVDRLGAGNRPSSSLPAVFDDLEERTFRWFWDTANPLNGLVPDNWPNPTFCSIAAVGFALTAYPVGVARGWISRRHARERTLATLRFFHDAPQGDAEKGISGYKGFFYHFLDMETGLRFGRAELSSVDTTLLFGGVLFAGQWFDRDHPEEAEIRRLSQAIYERADWPWFQRGQPVISMGWHPESGFITRNWDGYIEGMLIYVLALGSPTHPVGPEAWDAWCAPYDRYWRGEGPTRHLAFAPQFGHQYSHLWVDFRGIQDKVMREAGFDYFENSRRATVAQRSYAIANPMNWDGYSETIWGLTACVGPAHVKRDFNGEARQFYSYSARGPIDFPDGRDDGTLAPTAAIGSLPFAPEIVVPATLAMREWGGGRLYGHYGFYDAFNPSFRWSDIDLTFGKVDPAVGWVSDNYLGIDQGPIIGMIANHRDDFVWRTMRQVPAIRRGLERAGFTGGWLAAG
ncbi:glucoamylase family protein [Sphingomonas sp. DT-204]|uniref:glucoamylase family protein n=1 Tax=Sphingomonas sp. DT-204 TaxID=3396166 RepID=UPI003F1C26F7